MSVSAKEVANSFRWYRAFLKFKQPIVSTNLKSGYTNFTLKHAWENFNCQTQFLHREAIIPLMKRNPEVLDQQFATNGAVYFDLMAVSSKIGK